MIEKYFKNQGKLDRTQIALDIKNGKISELQLKKLFAEIDESLSEGKIENPYIENTKQYKEDKSEWNEQYLDLLVAQVSCLEAFTKEHLEHLLQVAKYVNGGGKRAMKKILIIIVAIVAVFVIGVLTGRNSMKKQVQKIQNQMENSIPLKAENESLKAENGKLKTILDEIQKMTAQANALNDTNHKAESEEK